MSNYDPLNDGYRSYGNSFRPTFMYDQRVQELMNIPVTGITSRDQIINPTELLDLDMYRRTARGKALYDSHLQALLNIQKQQQASYDEWYNSEEQQSVRQREAGINPNLNGVEASSTQSPDVSQASPVEGMQTVGQDALSGLSVAASLGGMVASGISACSQLAALPATIAASYASAGASSAAAALSSAQTDAVNLANVENFEKLASADVAARLADATSSFVGNTANAGQQFDFAGWFADPKNSAGIIDSYAPSDSPMYQNALSRVMSKHQKAIAQSYDIYGNRLKGQSSVAEMLSSPYYDENLVFQVGLMEPLYQAKKQRDLVMLDYETKFHQLQIAGLEGTDKELYIQNLNEDIRKRIAENNYYTDYFTTFDGDFNALYDMLIKQCDAINSRVEKDINLNLETIYNNNPHSYMGQRALSLILGGANLSWQDYLAYATNQGLIKLSELNNGISNPNQPLNIQINGTNLWNGSAGYRLPNGQSLPYYVPGNFGDVF